MLSGLENPLHILTLLFILLMIFGAKRLPEAGRSLGTAMREFRTGLLNTDTQSSHAANAPDAKRVHPEVAPPTPPTSEPSLD